MARADMSMNVESPSSDSELEDHFFYAAPGVKRSNSHNTNNDGNSDDGDSGRREYEPVASTSRSTASVKPHSPHKRIRTKAPAPPQGIKRAVPNRRLSDRHLQDEQVQLSDSETSFSRQPPPKKRQRGASSLQPTDKEDSIPTIDEAGPIAPRKLRAKRKPTRYRVSGSFNFTPETGPAVAISTGVEALLDRVEENRQEGNELYNAGHYDSALQAYSRALDQYPAGAEDVPPPLSLLSNRAAAYIALGRWEEALQDMRKAFCYPCTDSEGNVKRFTRYVKCLIALGKLEGEEVTEALGHMHDQLEAMLNSGKEASKVYRDGRKAYRELEESRDLIGWINTAREEAKYDEVLSHLEDLMKIQKSSKREPPQEWYLMYIEALAWQGRPDDALEILNEKLSSALSPSTPAGAWLNALISFGQGRVSTTIEALDTLRLAAELPKQASRLLHKAYSIRGYWDKIQDSVHSRRWEKVQVNANQIRRLADGLIGGEIVREAFVYTQLALLEMGDYEAVVNNMTASGYRYPEDPSLRIKANIILASALYCLARYKQAEGVCAEAMRFQRQSVDAKSLRMQMGDLQALVDKIREKQNEEIRLLQKGDPYKILGLSSTATRLEIKKAYKAQSLKHHPDKPGGNAERFKLISEAYQKLTAPPSTNRTSYSRYR